ncbi:MULTISPECIES: hypothetical protein [unclassified Nonomuraea]|uniref:hypothetical protein n=1 Tax=unclassified Nonomuraea TaxID=2593643 RepID=UPI00191C53FA|nr:MULTISPECIES: hypothetical protein [unclassified Nonomuraea]
MSDVTAQAVVGVYAALICLVALPRGWIADRVLGVRFIAVSVGDAIGGQAGRLTAVLSEPMYYLVLALAAIAAGFALFMFTRRLRVMMAQHHEPAMR